MEQEVEQQHKYKRYIKPAIIFTVIVAILLLYYFVNPVGSEWAKYMPKCVFKTLTGYDCPSCGTQRALHALLNGEIKTAILFNPFVLLVLPYLIALFYTTFSKSKFSTKIHPYVQGYKAAYIYIVLYIAWWVVRNTEWWAAVCESFR